MVAGIVHLVAPTARIMPLKAFSADGTSRTFDIVRAIYYAVDHGARVINLSFSASMASNEIARAINYATDRGVICVASVGNLGSEVVVYPGGFRNVVGVASTNSANPPVRSSFSNFGDALVSLAAPGEAIITTYPGGAYAAAWGTSFSTPIVAGAAALLVQIDPTLNFHKANDQFKKAIPHGAGHGRGAAESLRSRADAARCGRADGEHAHAGVDGFHLRRGAGVGIGLRQRCGGRRQVPSERQPVWCRGHDRAL